jgi:hypothetical protein
MIHVWRVEGQELVLNLRELLKYTEFNSVYIRDASNDKALSKREFKYIDFITNRDGFCVKEGYNDKEAHVFAVKNVGMPSDYIPDKYVLRAIDKARELNGGVIEDLIDSTVAAFRVDAKLVKHVRFLMEKIEGEVKDVADVENVLKLTDAVINISSVIPAKIIKLLALREEYDKQQSKTNNTKRGGGELSNSLDGTGIEQLQDTGQVERMD